MRPPIAILRTYTLLFLGACSLLGSESPALEPGDLTIQTDAQEYAPIDTVAITFTNHSAADLLLMSDGCQALDDKPLPNLRLEKQTDSTWETAGDYECPAIAVPPVEIEQGETYLVRFQLRILDKARESGTYRYLFDLRYEEDDEPGPQVAKGHRRSNRFEVNEQ